jgi:ABC-2 type transport system permease protein
MGVEVLRTIGWVHPIVLALLWGLEIAICTRVPAGEVDHGTIDVLLGLPASRWRVYFCESLVWALAGVVVIGMGGLGSVIENLGVPADARLTASQVFRIAVNLYCLYLAVGGLALLISSLSERRGRAVAVAFGCVLASFFLSFIAQFWEPAEALVFLSVLDYYRPILILRDAAWPLNDMAALLGCAVVFWVAGGLFFAKRDICTV